MKMKVKVILINLIPVCFGYPLFSTRKINPWLDDYTEYDSIGNIELRNEKIAKDLDLSKLNSQQFELVRKRLRLLSHLDRLNTFEELNGGFNTEMAQKNFKSGDYGNFREQNIVEYAAEKARKGSRFLIFVRIF